MKLEPHTPPAFVVGATPGKFIAEETGVFAFLFNWLGMQ